MTFPDDYGAEHLAGKDAQFAVTVKEVKRKKLPELDDEFASDHAGFDTLDELREDIALEAARGRRGSAPTPSTARRSSTPSSPARRSTFPTTLVEARARELWERMLHSLGHQGISKDAYLQISGKSEEEILDEAKPDAEQALRREAVIAAVIEAEDDRAVRRRRARRAAGLGRRARARPPRSCASAWSQPAAWTSCARTSPSAPRSTTSSSTPTRSSPGRAAAREKLWTPDKG